MSEVAAAQVERPRRLYLDWVPDVLFRPRQAFARLAGANTAVWLTPILILTLTALMYVWAAGSLKQAAAQTGQVPLPPDFQYYTPEQQAQYQQAMSATSGPVFIYAFPALMALAQVWIGWLLVSGLLHLVLTLLGGRGDTLGALNLVAWAALPLAVRDIVRFVALKSTGQIIQSPGLSGFVSAGEGAWNLFLLAFLTLVDIYVIWHGLLLILGTLAGNGLPRGKAIGGVLITLLLALLLQSLLAFGMSRLGGLTVVRPFFF